MAKPTCDLCEEDATQQFETDGGTVTRCADHEVPVYDVGSSWTQTLPKPKK